MMEVYFKEVKSNQMVKQLKMMLLKAFRKINIKTNIVLSGRTDKEVHATGQVFNCFVPDYWEDFFKLKEILNKNLPTSIKI